MGSGFTFRTWYIDEIAYNYVGEWYITDGISCYGPFSTLEYAKEACRIAAWGDRPLSR